MRFKILERLTPTVGVRTEIDDIMSVPLLAQRLLGHQVLDPRWTLRRFLPYQLVIATLFVYVIYGTKIIISQPEARIDVIAEGLYTVLTALICPFKLACLMYTKETFRQLYIMLKTTLYKIIQKDLKTKEAVLKENRKVVFALLWIVALPFWSYQVVALKDYVTGNRRWMSDATDTLLPMTTPYYELGWFFHSAFFAAACCIVMVIDLWFVVLMLYFCKASEVVVKILAVDRIQPDETPLAYAERLDRSLRKFYKNHIKLVKFTLKLSEMWRWMALIPLMNAAMSICNILLVLSHMIEIRTALLEFDWTSLVKKNRQHYYIIVLYVSKEFGLKTAVGHDLSLVTMSTVLKSSYQAFTVMNTVK
uniref:Odorant receptor n=1 Tax=Plutella xylostella TaxID=51655 RepID=A0A6M3YUU2_PLUXY|nr:odorant receptor 33 [Plutella xylostella]